LRALLANTFHTRTLDAWLGRLQSHGIPALPVLSYRDAMRHAPLRGVGMLPTDSEGHRHLNTPIRFAREPGQPTLRVPALGEHTAALAALRNHT
jgi:crotonobetainyl-CoA:carnitine CoA-transferase CaiB-like acyl-CoA transferase